MKKLNADRLRVAVFDWDGTLVESRTPRLWAVNRIMDQYGLPDWESTRDRQNKYYSFMDNFPLVFGDKAEEAYQKYFELYRQNFADMIKVFPGVRETLAMLKNNGVKIAIMTNKDRRLLELEVARLFEPGCFDKVVCGHEAARDKPYADHAAYTLEGLINKVDITPQTVWIIGDSVLDNICAAAVNALPVRIIGNGSEIEKIDDPSVVYFEDFSDFYRHLAG